jgi:pimeloyl-ACP methyl ester carboxylesterase
MVLTGSQALASTLNIAGNWQGIAKFGSVSFRTVVRISSNDKGGWKAELYNIDESLTPVPADSLRLEGRHLAVLLNAMHARFEGVLSADHNTIDGTLTEGVAVPLVLHRATKATAWPLDPSPYTVHFVTVDKDVKLEVLDWGGTGRPIILLTGLGDNAHRFGQFAPQLTPTYHVYGITRRGFGNSSPSPSGYSADRLADDVLTVMDVLSISKPVLVGHSLGGEELSSIGSRHPDRVAGLIYLDAAFGYAAYDTNRGDLRVDLNDLIANLQSLRRAYITGQYADLEKEVLGNDLPHLIQDLQEKQKRDADLPPTLKAAQTQPIETSENGPIAGIIAGMEKYTRLGNVPVLAIFAVPHNWGPEEWKDPAAWAAYNATDQETSEAQIAALLRAAPSARIVRLPNASHYVYLTNGADVLREMNAFIRSLP